MDNDILRDRYLQILSEEGGFQLGLGLLFFSFFFLICQVSSFGDSLGREYICLDSIEER